MNTTANNTSPRRSRFRNWLVLILLIAALFGGFYAINRVSNGAFLPGFGPSLTERMELLELEATRLQKQQVMLEERLATMDSAQDMADAEEAVNEGDRLDPQEVIKLQERLLSLETRMKTAPQTANSLANNPAFQEQLNEMRKEIEGLRSGPQDSSWFVALLLAFDQLKAAVSNGAPFRTELAKLDFLAPPDPDLDSTIDAIQPYAETGIATLAILKEDFRILTRKAIIADKDPGANANLWERFKANMAELITIRRTVDVEQEASNEGAIARAEIQLVTEANLGEALRELDDLKGKAAEVFLPWIENARAYLTVTDAMEQLDLHVQRVITKQPSEDVEPDPVSTKPAAAPPAPASANTDAEQPATEAAPEADGALPAAAPKPDTAQPATKSTHEQPNNQEPKIIIAPSAKAPATASPAEKSAR